jgi:hypothetical protein
MRTSLLLASLTLAAATAFSGVTQAQAGLPLPPAPPLPGVNVRVEGFLPAPPGVHIYYADERPYYVKRGRRVYLEKNPHYHGRGHKYGHRKHGRGH